MPVKESKISTKLWVSIFLVLGLMGAIAGIGMLRDNAILSEGRAKQDVLNQIAQVATRWSGLSETNAARAHAVLISSDPAVEAAFKKLMATTTADISTMQKALEALPLDAEERGQLEKLSPMRKSVILWREKAKELKAAAHVEEAMQVFNTQYAPVLAAYLDGQRTLVNMAERQSGLIAQQTDARRAQNTMVVSAGLVVVVAFVIAGAAWLVASIRDPLAHANEVADRIAKGDLRGMINTHRNDEFGRLLRSLADMSQSLGRMIEQVHQGSENIASASNEIANGNNDLARRTEEASSNLQATASNMDQLTSTVEHSADNARQASALASSASQVAQRGGEVVNQVVSTMQQIDASSKKIGDIISVIDGIAFQTNILALNAAVEAARAGEQGRGFAVVASEVRSLAQRSAEAAREIKVLINTSVEKVESGTRLVTDAGATMQEIVLSVQKVADVMGEITSAAAEQSAGILGVNRSIANLDQMTQQNAALVEQSAAAAESLRDEAQRVKQAVDVFSVA
jgi:methyl-accepting chemotaxis protein